MQTVLDPLLEALDYAHKSGIPHGGITPENVLITTEGTAMLSDFATVKWQRNGNSRYAPAQYFSNEGNPTTRADFYAICEIYKEFLPERSPDDEAGVEARERLLRNLCEVQLSSASIDELHYKLGAVTKMAALLGFNSEAVEQGKRYQRRSARLESQLTPASIEINPGAVGSVTLTVRNAGDYELTCGNSRGGCGLAQLSHPVYSVCTASGYRSRTHFCHLRRSPATGRLSN